MYNIDIETPPPTPLTIDEIGLALYQAYTVVGLNADTNALVVSDGWTLHVYLPNAARQIGGIVVPSYPYYERLSLYNIATNVARTITLVHEAVTANADERIIGPNNANIVIPAGGAASLFYYEDQLSGLNRWRLFSQT